MNRVVAITGAVSLCFAAHAMGAELTDQTRCVDAIKRFDPPQTGLGELADYIKNVMELLDRKHTEDGEPGIIAQLSDDGFWNLVGSTTVWCRDHPRQTVYNAAAFVYTGTRELELELGTAK
jgi:hypothetical protein